MNEGSLRALGYLGICCAASPLANGFFGCFNARVLLQQSLNGSASFTGIGLHSGNRVNMTFLPAPAGSGIRFRRVDLDGKPEIEARVENVVETSRSTTLGKGNIRIQTVEHVLAAFSGFGIDNAIVELDANEPPIADGSAREYCRMIHAAGTVALGDNREPYTVTEPIEVEMDETAMTLFPDELFRITCTSADKQGRFTQHFSTEITPKTWERELSHARTFCFYEEIEYLIKNGLIKGGSLENAVVIREDAVLTTEPLRYREEFVRHKMLDIVGDLSLLGRPIHGHVIAVKPSHAANVELVRRLVAQIRKPSPPFLPPLGSATTTSGALSNGSPYAMEATGMDIERLLELLPHRYPFLMVDRILKIEGNRIVGLKCVSANENYFPGHFPDHPIMPGVLQLEAIAQVAGILMLTRGASAKQLAYFMSAEDVKWRKPVRPGDVLIIDVEISKVRGKIAKAKGTCRVGEEVVSEALVTFMLTDA